MINTLITGITGLFSKEYLLSSFLPALWFLVTIAGLFLSVTGWVGPVEQVDSWTAGQKALAAAGGSVALAVFGYVLQALHPLFTELWSGKLGNSPFLLFLWGPREISLAFQRHRYEKLNRSAQQLSKWRGWFDGFAAAALPHYQKQQPAISQSAEDRLLTDISTLSPDSSEAHVDAIAKRIIDAYQQFHGDSLQRVYQRFQQVMFSNHAEKTYAIQTCAAALDREFATQVTIQPTTLGNIIASYNEYSFKRYGMEGEVFWPRLRQVVKGDLPPLLDDRKIVLDFALTAASLTLVTTFLAAFAGPWLWHNLTLWGLAFLVGALLTTLFYWLAVIVARQLGELVRSTYDLFRWDLLLSLHLQVPDQMTLGDERRLWERVSQWIVYGMASGEIAFQVPKPKKDA